MSKNWFPKTLAEWKEPRLFTRWRAAGEVKTWPLEKRLVLLGFFVFLFVLPRCLGDDGFRLPTPTDVLQSVVMVLFISVTPRLAALTPCRVRITEHGFSLVSASHRLLAFDQIERVATRRREIDGRRFDVLLLQDLEGRTLEIAVADTISLPRIGEILRREGIQFGD